MQITRTDLLKALDYRAFKYLSRKGILNIVINKILRIIREEGYNHILGGYFVHKSQESKYGYELKCSSNRFGINVYDGYKLYILVIYKLEYYE